MKDLRSKLADAIDLFAPRDGFHESPVPGVYCLKASHPYQIAKCHWRACLSIVAQGRKEIILGHETYRCNRAHYMVNPIDLPVVGRIAFASCQRPFLCLLIVLDPLTLGEIAAQFEGDLSKEAEPHPQAMFVGKACNEMLAAAIRLNGLFRTPEDAPVLGPLVIKEILYHLLKGPNGPAIRRFVCSGSKMHKVSQAIETLISERRENVNIGALAEAANMSRSAFFKCFKAATSVDPVQYQRSFRLLEARRLILHEGETAECSGFRVGYQSSSQFSRDYSRMFGKSPLWDANTIPDLRDRLDQHL